MTVTRNMNPADSFMTAGLSIAFMSIFVLYTVKEPDMKKIHAHAEHVYNDLEHLSED